MSLLYLVILHYAISLCIVYYNAIFRNVCCFVFYPGVSHVPIIGKDKKSTLIRFSRSNDSQVQEIVTYMYDSFLKCTYAAYKASRVYIVYRLYCR